MIRDGQLPEAVCTSGIKILKATGCRVIASGIGRKYLPWLVIVPLCTESGIRCSGKPALHKQNIPCCQIRERDLIRHRTYKLHTLSGRRDQVYRKVANIAVPEMKLYCTNTLCTGEIIVKQVVNLDLQVDRLQILDGGSEVKTALRLNTHPEEHTCAHADALPNTVSHGLQLQKYNPVVVRQARGKVASTKTSCWSDIL
jgi:hypothetical protein